ncbi:MAG: NUDIX hydrolase [Phycisphaerae bacterium]
MPLELLDKQVIYHGRKVALELHHLRDPEDDTRHTREVCRHPGAVVILPILDDGTVLLIRVRRYAVGKPLIELPAGTLEKGEPPIDCAGRELEEEAGYLAGRLKSLGAFYTSPGILTEEMYPFLATDLTKTQQALEEGEEIQVLPTPYDEAIEMCRDGRIVDGKTIATLLKYHAFHR